MTARHPKEAICGLAPGPSFDGSIGMDGRFQARAGLLTVRQPSTPGFASSDGLCDRGTPYPRAAFSADGVPGSHGPPEASVNEPSLTFGYPADGIRHADDRSVWPGSSVDGGRAGVSTTSVRWFDGPCDRGTPCRPDAPGADRLPGSLGPPEAGVKAPSLTIRYRPGASPCHDGPQGRPCHDGGDDPSGHDRADPPSWPRAPWSPRRIRSCSGPAREPPSVTPGERG
jgi:hypothetical protein